MKARDWVNQWADENDMPLLVMDEYDEAIVGICHRFNDTFVLYDRAKIIEILARDMTEDAAELNEDAETMAWEHFDFNIIGGWVGEHTPAFVEYPPEKSDQEIQEERERAQVEAERMEVYEGGPLPDANFFDHDQD